VVEPTWRAATPWSEGGRLGLPSAAAAAAAAADDDDDDDDDDNDDDDDDVRRSHNACFATLIAALLVSNACAHAATPAYPRTSCRNGVAYNEK
jgi:hypothetical protein